MKRIFADTSYWIALVDKNDLMHLNAKKIANQLGLVNIVTSELILVELLNAFSRHGVYLKEISIKLTETIIHSQQIKIVSMNSNQFHEGYNLYKKFKSFDTVVKIH